MCEGRCREPRCIRSPGRGWQRSSLLHRGFFTRRTIRRVLRVALAAFSAAPWQGFEKAERCPSLASLFPPQAAVGSAAVRIHPCIPFFKADKTETPVPGSDTGVLGGRGWITRAALLKTAHWAVFALSSATAPQLFESTRSMSLALLQNKSLSALAYAEAFWWARVDSNHRS